MNEDGEHSLIKEGEVSCAELDYVTPGPLPEGWNEYFDEQARAAWYWHALTGKAQLDRPESDERGMAR